MLCASAGVSMSIVMDTWECEFMAELVDQQRSEFNKF